MTFLTMSTKMGLIMSPISSEPAGVSLSSHAIPNATSLAIITHEINCHHHTCN